MQRTGIGRTSLPAVLTYLIRTKQASGNQTLEAPRHQTKRQRTKK